MHKGHREQALTWTISEEVECISEGYLRAIFLEKFRKYFETWTLSQGS